MLGFIMALVAGAAMSFQGVMNTRLSEKIGLLESNAYVQGTAFLLSAVALALFGKGQLQSLFSANWLYLLGGVLGLVITVTVMLSIQGLTPTVAISTILISQLFSAALIDAMGILGAEKAPFIWQKWLGLALMVGGVVLMKLKSN
ncbi:MAG: DMT family transporter [Eubacteriales bacterium]|nr:DMT family transporter [Eubacteriales bacterium]MDD3880837.1 DMT family transporter [Eubacteriales bacterium]MDD4511796.1 DMT family transporter [Eubacteriales bacterium]